MAKKATGSGRTRKAGEGGRARSSSSGGRQVARRTSSKSDSASDMLLKLLESPLVAELIAVGATAALAAIAAQGFSKTEGGRRSTRMLKAAAKAAGSAVGARLATEFDEIKRAAKSSGGGAA